MLNYKVNDEDYMCEATPLSKNDCFGKLYRCTKKLTGDKFVRRILSKNFKSTESGDNFFNNELSNFSCISKHPAIENFEGYSLSNSKRSLYCKYYENGSLFDILNTDSIDNTAYLDKWDGTAKSKAIFGVAAALLHIHSHKTIHGYLSAKRILFDSFMNPYVSDFGYCKAHINQDSLLLHSKIQVEMIYTPPELLDNSKSPQYTTDAFAFGTILYQIVTSENPFKGLNLGDTIRKISKHEFPEVPKTAAPILKVLIEKCWSDKRPNFSEIVYLLRKEVNPLFEGTDMTAFERYRTEVYAKTDLDESIRSIAEKDSKGDPSSMYAYGCRLMTGNGVEKNEEEAFAYFNQAAAKNFPLAVYRTARNYECGIGVEKNKDEAFKLMERSYKLNVSKSFLRYGTMLENLGKKNEALAVFREGELKGIGECSLKLGQCFLQEGNIKDALFALTKAAKKNIPEADNEKAMIYLKGYKNFEPNIPKAFDLFSKSMNNGCGAAAWNLAILYRPSTGGEKRILKPDQANFIYYLKKAVELNNVSAKKEYANILLNGLNGFKQNEVLGRKLLKSAGDSGDSESLYNYANLCKDGRGGEKDTKTAKKYSRMAISDGYVKGYLQYGRILYEEIKTGLVEPSMTNINMCTFFLKKAVKNGLDEAVKNDLDEANELLNDLATKKEQICGKVV